MAVEAPRYGLHPYNEWVARERIPISEGISLDLFAVPTGDWPRYGVKGAIAKFPGGGDQCNMFVLDIGAGQATHPQQHLYEEIVFVLEGRGSTQLEFRDGTKRSFEWGPRSFFGIPLNARHRHFNASGTQRALLASTTTLPIVINLFHNEAFVFDTPFGFDDRTGKEAYYLGEGDLHLIAPGSNIWETNFVPDLGTIELTEWGDRGPGSTNINFVMADGIMHAHVSEIAPATYKKAHRHNAGLYVMTLTGNGYSLLWYEGDREFTRVDWKYGVVFPPLEGQFHQHFVTSNDASRYVATGFGGIRYPTTDLRRSLWAPDAEMKTAFSRSVKEGGNQVEYEDQDPRIHQIWLEEMRKAGITPRLTLPVTTSR